MTTLGDAILRLLVEGPKRIGVPLRYVDHWPHRGPCERRIESDPNPMPVFRLPLVRLWRWRW